MKEDIKNFFKTIGNIDNIYFETYEKICCDVSGKVEHHIVPKTLDERSIFKNEIAYVSNYNHLYLHCLLIKFLTGKALMKMYFAFNMMCSLFLKDIDPFSDYAKTLYEEYDVLRSKHIHSFKRRPMTEKEKEVLSFNNKGCIWVTNGDINNFIKPDELQDFINKGFYKGRTIKKYYTEAAIEERTTRKRRLEIARNERRKEKRKEENKWGKWLEGAELRKREKYYNDLMKKLDKINELKKYKETPEYKEKLKIRGENISKSLKGHSTSEATRKKISETLKGKKD
jgi:hypothetical protein